MNKPIVQFKNIEMRFGPNVVHRDISLDIGRGESLTFLGPSGTGKTVLLKMIIGLLSPTAGSVHVFDQDISQLEEGELTKVRQEAGMLFQGGALFDSLSVFENIAYPLYEAGERDPLNVKNRVFETLELVGLPEVAEKSPSELSGGQKKRIGLARALASKPEIILLDEPTTGLDPTSIRRIDNVIIRLNEELGITTISVTHDIESAKRISKRWILLHNGHVSADGPVEELIQHNERVQHFIEGNWNTGE